MGNIYNIIQYRIYIHKEKRLQRDLILKHWSISVVSNHPMPKVCIVILWYLCTERLRDLNECKVHLLELAIIAIAQVNLW